MWTIGYKGLYIHGYCDKDVCQVISGSGETIARDCKSLRAAKIAVSKFLRKDK